MHWQYSIRQFFVTSIVSLAAFSSTTWAADPPVNTFLSAPKYSITHFDSSQSDAFPYSVPTDSRHISGLLFLPPSPQVPAGPINLMTLASTSPNYMWGVSSTGVNYIDVSDDNFKSISTLLFPGVTPTLVNTLNGLLTNPINTIAQAQNILGQLGLPFVGGLPSAYSVVDKDNILYTNYGNQIYAFEFVPAGGLLSPAHIHIKRQLDTTTFLQSGETIAGVVMTYDGKLVVLGTRSATVVNRENFNAPKFTTTFASDESISNSAAVDENNGIYIVTNKLMRKIIWTGSALSQNPADGAWSAPYPTGDTFYTAFGSGSGSTPTLMGFGSDPDKLVVITDGLKRMSLIAFWRDQIPVGFTDRLAGQIQVNCGLPAAYEIQTDQSVAVNGYGAFVVNNVSTATGSTGSGTSPLVDNLLRGIYPSPMGVERFAWDPLAHSWSSVWARSDVASTSMVPAISTGSNIVFTNGYYQNGWGWVVTGMNWNTGATVHQTIFGTGELGNGFYALIQFLPDGDLLFNSILGPTRVQEPSGQVIPPPLL